MAVVSAVPLIGLGAARAPADAAPAQARDNLTRGIDAARRPRPPAGAGPGLGARLVARADARRHRRRGSTGSPAAPAAPPTGRWRSWWPRSSCCSPSPAGSACWSSARAASDPQRAAGPRRHPRRLLRARAAALQPRSGAAGRDRPRARRHPRPDDHRGRGRARLRVGDEPRRQERQGPAGRGAGAHPAGHRRRPAAPGGLPGARRADRRARPAAASSAPSSRPTRTASRSPTCCAPRRRRCGSSGVSGPRRRRCRSR